MLKEGENIVFLKLRIQDEIKDLTLNHPELLDEYKKDALKSLFTSVTSKETMSAKDFRDVVSTIEPDFYQGQTLEQAEEEWESMKAGLIFVSLFVFIVGALILKLVF
jgi:hypothetical protein